MKVLLIGGTVFIGRAIATELVDAGHELCLLHRGNHEPEGLPDATHIHVDRKELASAGKEIESFTPDAVVDNMAITRADAQGAIDVFPQDMRYVVISSMDVYAAYGSLHAGTDTEPLPVDESSPVRTERYPFRGAAPHMEDYEKLDVEEVYATRDATILRLPMVYGEHDYQRREEWILRRVRAGRKRIPIGAGTWLGVKGYVGDIARGVRLALESDAAKGEIFNLGESHTYAMSAWGRMILEAASSGAELVRVPDDRLPKDLELAGTVSQHFLVDSSKARRVLDWTDSDPREALKCSVAWHLAHPPEGDDPGFDADDLAL